MDNLIVLGVVALIVTGAGLYILKQKQAGARCIGCPDSKTCDGKCKSCSGCSCNCH